jgi:hypothetical protein
MSEKTEPYVSLVAVAAMPSSKPLMCASSRRICVIRAACYISYHVLHLKTL